MHFTLRRVENINGAQAKGPEYLIVSPNWPGIDEEGRFGYQVGEVFVAKIF